MFKSTVMAPPIGYIFVPSSYQSHSFYKAFDSSHIANDTGHPIPCKGNPSQLLYNKVFSLSLTSQKD